MLFGGANGVDCLTRLHAASARGRITTNSLEINSNGNAACFDFRCLFWPWATLSGIVSGTESNYLPV